MKTATSARSKETFDSIANQLNHRVKPVNRSPAYAFALVVTALLMVLIPVAYLSLTVAIGYGIYLYIIHAAAFFFTGGSGALMRFIFYLGPPLAGAIMIFFMFKPLLAKPSTEESCDPLDISDEREFMNFVNSIARAVGAPLPCSVVVDTNVNASASFAPGVINFFRRKLVLTIGLPLLRGMNTRELAGILAHEFGHFSQGFGMYFSLIIRNISFWLHRVVYDRDKWDATLEHTARNVDLRIGIMLHLARGMIWLNRKILWCFMMLGHLISFYLLRQMEYDADQYEAQVSGSDQFEKTSNHLVCLGAAYQESVYWASNAWHSRRLPNDFGYLVSSCEKDLDSELRRKITEEANKDEKSLWETHPSNAARIRRVNSRPAPGIFTIEIHCTTLFKNFDAVSQECSRRLYLNVLGEESAKADLQSSEYFVNESRKKRQHLDAFDRFFGTICGMPVPLPFNCRICDIPLTDAVLDELKNSREEIKKQMKTISEQSEAYDQLYEKLVQVLQGKAVLTGGFRIEENQFGFEGSTLTDADIAETEIRRGLELAYSQLMKTAKPVCRRLECGLRIALASNPQIQSMISSAELLTKSAHNVRAVIEHLIGAEILLSQDPTGSDKHSSAIAKYCTDARECVNSICKELGDTPYPFEGEIQEPTLAAHLRESRRQWDERVGDSGT
ncbi:MAG: M48 family metalloprotease, partial [Chitinispirillaceae bacterium]